jgi:hypothetical protein
MINLYFISHNRFPHAAIPTVTHESAVLNTSKNGRLITPPAFRHYQGRLLIKRPQNQP